MNPVQVLDELLQEMQIGDSINAPQFASQYYKHTGEVITFYDDTFMCYVMSTNHFTSGKLHLFRRDNKFVAEKVEIT